MEIRKSKILFLAIMAVIVLSTTNVVAQENRCNTIKFRSFMMENVNHLMQPYGVKVVDLYDFKTIKFDEIKQEAVCEGTAQWMDMSIEKIRFTSYKNSMNQPLVKIEAI